MSDILNNETLLKDLTKTIHYMDIDAPRFIDKVAIDRMRKGQFLKTKNDRYVLENRDLGLVLNDALPLMITDDRIKELLLEVVDGPIKTEDLVIHVQHGDILARKYVLYNGNVMLVMSLGVDEDTFAVTAVGEPNLVAETMLAYRENFTLARRVRYDHIVGFGQQGPIVNSHNLTVEEARKQLAHDAFYPNIPEGIDQLVENFRNSNSTILLLVGARGLGKTTLIRTIASKLDRDINILADNEEVITSPGFMPYIQSHTRGLTISIEDADNLCKKREDGNTQMSALLNYADGVVRTSTKMIISTNLPGLAKIDEALYRPGRTFRVLSFGELTLEQANKAREALDLPAIEEFTPTIQQRGTLSLAEALNYEESLAFDRSVKFGFNQ